MSTTLAVTDNWVEWGNNTSGTITTTGFDVYPYNSYYPWAYSVYYTSPARPIKLTLTEVEVLRAAARKDKKVRDVLRKFTPQIEIEVDFP